LTCRPGSNPRVDEHHFEAGADGERTAWLAHPDGSWARATAVGQEPPVVRQEGPRRLWDIADEIRHAWLTDGTLPATSIPDRPS
jgi:hypothetical protein